jgi:ketosteroid isomerase-like protein
MASGLENESTVDHSGNAVVKTLPLSLDAREPHRCAEQYTQQNIKMYLKIASFTIFDLSLLILVGQETDQAKPEASVLDAIAGRESQYLDGLLHRNFEELASVLADTYVNTSPFGPVRNKVEFLEALKADTSRISEITETEKQTQVYGDTAIVIVKFEVHGTDEGEAFQFDGRAVDIWAKLNGEWLCVAVTVSQTR